MEESGKFYSRPSEGKRGKPMGEAFRRPMRWLLIALIVSVCALLVATGGLALHIRRQHRKPSAKSGQSRGAQHEEGEMESEEAP